MNDVKLTKAQTRVLCVIQESIRDQGRPPTRAEIASTLGYRSINAAESHLRALERRGVIRLQSGTSRGIQCLLPMDDVIIDEALVVIGKVAAGVPIDSPANVEKTVPVKADLFQLMPDYLLRVKGDSMINIGIFDGDLLAVKKSNTAHHGDIIVARVNGDVTVKRLDHSESRLRLLPENDLYDPIDIDPDAEFFVEGHAVGVIRTSL